MSVKVTVPNKHFNGVRAGVQFENGEAICDEKSVKIMESYGYSVEPVEGEKVEKPKAKKAPAKKAPKKVEE